MDIGLESRGCLEWFRQLTIAAVPPSVRKAYGFPGVVTRERLRLGGRRSLQAMNRVFRKGVAIPHGARQSRRTYSPRQQLLSVSEFWISDLRISTLDVFSVDRKIFRFRVMSDDRGSRLLRFQLKLFSQFDADPSGVK